MGKKTVGRKSETLVKAVIEVIKEHKGKEVVSLDLNFRLVLPKNINVFNIRMLKLKKLILTT